MQQQVLDPMASLRETRVDPAFRIKPLMAIFLDPLWLGPIFIALLILNTVFEFPRLTFGLADVLGLSLNFSALSLPQNLLMTAVRAWFVAALARALWTRSLVVPGLAGASLLVVCYFPLAWGWLGWVAVTPLLCLVRSDTNGWRTYFYAWYAGLAFFWPALEWMRVADFRMYGTWAMLATYCALYFPAAICLIRRLDRTTSVPLVISVPIVWTGLEFIRSFLLTGFAWYYLGHTQHRFLPMIQIADLGGAYAVSFVMAMANAWLFELLYTRQWLAFLFRFAEERVQPSRPECGRWIAIQGLIAASLVVGTLFYGFRRLEQPEFAPGPTVALLQGNLDQRLRNMATGERNVLAIKQISQHFFTLCRSAAHQQPPPDLVVWPETSFPFDWYEVSPHLPAPKIPADWVAKGERIQSLMQLLASDMKTHLVLGLNANVLDDAGEEVRYNSALLVTPERRWGPRYDKKHRVPFGEYVPELPFMEQFAPYDHPYSITPGASFTRFPLGKYHFGVIICFEDTDPLLARHYGRADADGPAVDFLLNISNDGWFDGSSEHDEHLAICRFRAVECRRAIARAVNMGISAVIDSNGRVLPPRSSTSYGDFWNWQAVGPEDQTSDLATSRWSSFKKTAGILTATIPIDERTSLYAIFGDWLPLSCWAVILAGLAWPLLRWKRPAPVPPGMTSALNALRGSQS